MTADDPDLADVHIQRVVDVVSDSKDFFARRARGTVESDVELIVAAATLGDVLEDAMRDAYGDDVVDPLWYSETVGADVLSDDERAGLCRAGDCIRHGRGTAECPIYMAEREVVQKQRKSGGGE